MHRRCVSAQRRACWQAGEPAHVMQADEACTCKGGGEGMECAGRASRTSAAVRGAKDVVRAAFVVRVAHAAKDVALATFVAPLAATAASPRRVSNRQSLTRLENVATCRKQTPEAKSNRHNRDGRHVWSCHHRNGFAAPAPARISCHVSSRAGCLALNSTPYTSRSKIHPNSLKTIAGAHFYYEQMNQTVCATESS